MMTKLTKSQRRRRNEKRKDQQNQDWIERMGQAPSNDISRFWKPNITENFIAEPWERAPAHVVDYDAHTEEDCPEINIDAMKSISNKAAAIRKEDGEERHRELRNKYPHLIGVRGGAARARNKALVDYKNSKKLADMDGSDAGEPPPSLRTFQRAFKKVKK